MTMSETLKTAAGAAKIAVDLPPADAAPSAQLAASAAREIFVTDERGRAIKLKKPGVLAQFQLIEALGDTARNEVYMAMTLPLLFVAALDGEVVIRPNTKPELEALIQRLDEDGIQAVMTGVVANFGGVDESAAKNG
jgi:hypothetical protein